MGDIFNPDAPLAPDTLSVPDSTIDHGGIGGLGDDDHTIYLKADGTRELTGSQTVSDGIWFGLGAAAGRIEFEDTTVDEINFLDCNVGIRTATPLYDLDIRGSDTASLLHFSSSDVDSGGYLTSVSADNFFMSCGAEYTGSAWKAKSTTASIIGGQAGKLQFFTNTGLTPGSTFTVSEKMRITETGTVGIGGTPSLGNLHVFGTPLSGITAETTSTATNAVAYFAMRNTAGNLPLIFFGGGVNYDPSAYPATSGQVAIMHAQEGKLHFSADTGSSPHDLHMTLDTAGNLCIGTVTRGASRGFYLSNSAADENKLYQCLSEGNGTAGYEIVSGCQYNAIAYCVSGGRDGARVDNGTNNVWSNFSFENILANTQTLSGSGSPITVSTNLFQIYGTVEIDYIHGCIDTQLGADVDNVYLDAYDGANSVPLTKTTTLDLDAAPVGSLLHKTADAADILTYEQSDQVRLYEDATKFGVDRTFVLNAKNGANNYIRMTYTTTDTPTSGVIHWHIEWRPMSDDGYVKVV